MRMITAFLCAAVSAAAATLSFGVEFRATAAHASTAANDTYSLGEAYPTTRTPVGQSSGQTFGWVTSIGGSSGVSYAGQMRDRTNTDPRLAGDAATANTSTQANSFRIDLGSPGTYTLTLAAGDQANTETEYIQVYDGGNISAPVIIFGSPTSTPPNSFMAADGSVYTAANWTSTGSTVTVTITISGTSIYIRPGRTSTTGGSNLAYISVAAVAVAPATIRHRVQGGLQ